MVGLGELAGVGQDVEEFFYIFVLVIVVMFILLFVFVFVFMFGLLVMKLFGEQFMVWLKQGIVL